MFAFHKRGGDVAAPALQCKSPQSLATAGGTQKVNLGERRSPPENPADVWESSTLWRRPVWLPGLGAVAAGAGRGHLGVAGQGPGVRRRLEPLHVPSEEGEQSCGGVGGRLAALALQQLHQEVDVAHGQAQDLVLAQLLLRRVGGDELAELGEGRVDVVLAPALPRVGEHLPGHGAERGAGVITTRK